MQRHLYPKNWEELSLRVRDEAGWQCEWCPAVHGLPNPKTGSLVVLTVAHLNHVKADDSRENLVALCQNCHLSYDAQEKADQIYKKRRQLELHQELPGLEPAGGA